MQVSPGWQRAIGAAVVLPTAALSLPVTALLLDDKLDNGLFPVSAGAAALIGAGTGAAMPAMFGAGRGRLAAAGIGAGIGFGISLAVDAALLFGIADR
jgi:hypothetical protein